AVNGVHVTGAGTSNNLVEGNYVGPTAGGKSAIPNGTNGVLIDAGATGNTLGGTGNVNTRNVVSGNTSGVGVRLVDAATTGNVVEGNFIGPDATGAADLPNLDGIRID